MARCVLGLRRRHVFADSYFDQSISWEDKEEAVAGAMYEIMEAAGDDVRKLHARVLKILDNRAKSMPTMQAKARSQYAEEKEEEEVIKHEMRRICRNLGDDILSEEDILTLWREVLVEGVQEET